MAVIRIISFDAVDTILFASPPVVDVYHQTAIRYGINIPVHVLKEQMNQQFRIMPPLAHRGSPESGREFAYRWWYQYVEGVFKPYLTNGELPFFNELFEHFARPQAWVIPGYVFKWFEFIQQEGMSIIIASGFDDRLRKILSEKGLISFNPRFFLSTEVGYSKSSVDFYQYIIRQLNVTPESILHIGDNPIEDDRIPSLVGINTCRIDALKQGQFEHEKGGMLSFILSTLHQLTCDNREDKSS